VRPLDTGLLEQDRGLGKIDVDPFDPELLNPSNSSSACLRAHVRNDLDQLLQCSGIPLLFTYNLLGDALNPWQGPVEQEFPMISGEGSGSSSDGISSYETFG